MSYVIEYAKSGRSSCIGPKNVCPVQDRTIEKGELRLGVQPSQIHGVSWRHWTCTTPKVMENMSKAFDSPENIDGFNELRDDDQERIFRAWDEGKIPENERPEPYIKKKKEGDEEILNKKIKTTMARSNKSNSNQEKRPAKKIARHIENDEKVDKKSTPANTPKKRKSITAEPSVKKVKHGDE